MAANRTRIRGLNMSGWYHRGRCGSTCSCHVIRSARLCVSSHAIEDGLRHLAAGCDEPAVRMRRRAARLVVLVRNAEAALAAQDARRRAPVLGRAAHLVGDVVEPVDGRFVHRRQLDDEGAERRRHEALQHVEHRVGSLADDAMALGGAVVQDDVAPAIRRGGQQECWSGARAPDRAASQTTSPSPSGSRRSGMRPKR